MLPQRKPPLVATTLAGALTLAACGGHAPPDWTDLASLPGASALPNVRDDVPQAPLGGHPARLASDAAGERWIEVELMRSDWRRARRRDTWIATVPAVRSPVRDADPTAGVRLRDAHRTYHHAGLRDAQGAFEVGPGSFLVASGFVQLQLERGAEPPAEATLAWRATHAGAVDDGFASVNGRVFSGAGLAVAPGETRTLEVELPPRAALSFATCSEPAVDASDQRHVFRVRIDGRVLFEERQALSPRGTSRWHRIALSDATRARAGERATLSFEVEGPFAYTSFLAPTLGPREPRPRAERSRPDLVLFVADTLRADCLDTFGGTLGLTPHLDRLAGQGLAFAAARSVGTWTLPVHASLLTGLFPHQTGAVTMTSSLPAATRTIAELLRDHGYRTGAVTEGGFVSANHGLAQGFGWFVEREIDWDGVRDDDLAATLDAAQRFLDAEDGRPAFLFVHTYRTHAPYAVSRATRAEYGERLGLDFPETYAELFGRYEALAEPIAADDPLARQLHGLYQGTAVDLDRAFGGFLADLGARGVLEHGYLVFTSDHGETFGEHGALCHTGPAHEELVRVPLILAGPGIEPAREPAAVSLVDVFPTLAQLANVPVTADRPGRSLLEHAGPRVLYAFECEPQGAPDSLAIVDGDHKVIASFLRDLVGGREVYAAFELNRDPAEQVDLNEQGAAWPERLVERQADEIDACLEPAFPAASAALDATDRAELEALGYLDEGS